MPTPRITRHTGAPASTILALFLCLAAMGQVKAHAIVVGSSLEERPVNARTPTTVQLRFNASIEKGFTQVLLRNPEGREMPLHVSPGNGPGVVDVDLPALDAGAYKLHYKVLATDGHIAEDTIRFHVSRSP